MRHAAAAAVRRAAYFIRGYDAASCVPRDGRYVGILMTTIWQCFMSHSVECPVTAIARKRINRIERQRYSVVTPRNDSLQAITKDTISVLSLLQRKSRWRKILAGRYCAARWIVEKNAEKSQRNVRDKLSENAHEIKKLKFAPRQAWWIALIKFLNKNPSCCFSRARNLRAVYRTRARARARDASVPLWLPVLEAEHTFNAMDRKFCMHSWLAACNGGTIDRARYARSDAALLRGSRRWTGREFTARVIRAWYVLCSDKRRASLCADFGP